MVKRLLFCLPLALAIAQGAFAQTPADQAPPIDAKHQKDIDADVAQGKDLVKQVEKYYKISKDQAMQDRVKKIGDQMAAIANKTKIDALWGDKRFSKFDYDFTVLDGKDVNAFSLPGGHIYVYEGLMKFVQTDDELAAVLGHEISHASLRHVATLQREASKAQAIEIPLILATILKGGRSSGDVFQGIVLAQNGIFSGWSIKAEKAADYGGFQYMRKSPYNTTACLTVVERLAQEERANPQLDVDWGIFRTHPPSEERVAAILKDIEVAKVPIQRSAVTTSLSTHLKKTDEGVQAWFGEQLLYTFTGDDAQTRADDAMKRLNPFFDSVPQMFDVEVKGSTIIGDHKVLFDIDPADAGRARTTVSQLATKTLASIKGALYKLNFSVWQPGLP